MLPRACVRNWNLPGWGPRADRIRVLPARRADSVRERDGRRGDEAQREPWANLSYVPLYDVREIEEKIDREARRLFAWLIAVMVLIPTACLPTSNWESGGWRSRSSPISPA